ncbi:MAG: single-stranded DNA-binding protein [Chloroflexia bacterium]|nr:single-stranded DNA-binding protein [Chloroflexia bacterium]
MRIVLGTLNRVELIGWVGGEPEVKSIGKDSKLCTFSVSTKRMTGRVNGTMQYESEWMTVEAWDRVADRCIKNLHRGSRVMVLGSLLTRSWEDRESGQRRYRTIVRAAECFAVSAAEGDDNHEEVEEDESVMA